MDRGNKRDNKYVKLTKIYSSFIKSNFLYFHIEKYGVDKYFIRINKNKTGFFDFIYDFKQDKWIKTSVYPITVNYTSNIFDCLEIIEEYFNINLYELNIL